MAKLSLTHKQQIMLEFVQRFMAEHRKSPLIREIRIGCNILSYKSVLDRLNALEHKGFIRRIPSKHRGIRLIRKALPPQLGKTLNEFEQAGEGVAAG